MCINIEFFPLKEPIGLFDIKYFKKKKASSLRTTKGRLLWKCKKGEGLHSGRFQKALSNLEIVRQKDLGVQKIMGIRKRDGHVYPTESFCKNAVFISNAWEYVLFNHLIVQTLTKGNKHVKEFIFTFPLWFQLIGLGKNKLSLFTSFK